MRSRRSVTAQPIGMPSRSLKPAIDFFAFRTVAFWPVIVPRSRAAVSTFDFDSTAPFTPMLMTIFSSFGTACAFSMAKDSESLPRTSLWYFSWRRVAIASVAAERGEPVWVGSRVPARWVVE